jgi:hypothetical protein
VKKKNQLGSSRILFVLLLVCATFAGGYWVANATRPDVLPAAFQLASGGSAAGTEITRPALFTEGQALDFPWPPRLGEPFPNLELVSHTGEVVRIADFRGKIVLVEPIGMTCAACNAFSGAGETGGYQKIAPQKNLPSIEKLIQRYAPGHSLDDEGIVLVQLLLYDMNLQAPSADDARQWAEHFGFHRKDNVYVLAADQRFINKASYDMIPGFFLLDQDLVLRADATGHQPRHNLFTELLAQIPELLIAEAKAAPTAVQESPLELTLSVAAAYQAIPHQRTTFRPDIAAMPAGEVRYFERLFELTDIAMVERVQTLQWFQTRGAKGAKAHNYEQILARFNALPTPSHLAPVHGLIRQAITEQRQYFSSVDNGRTFRFDANASLVQNSHNKLVKAYKLLMVQFPNEHEHNRTAFFDHLCALDFI